MIPQEEIDILMGMEEKEAKMANRYDPVGRTDGMANAAIGDLHSAYERGYQDGRADAQATDAQIIELGQKIESEAYERGYKDGQKEINDKYRIQMDDGTFKRTADAIEKDAYDRGYKDGQRDTESNNALANGFALAQKEKGRDEGRREAWEAARKIALTGADDDGIPESDLREMFDMTAFGIFREAGVDEVIEKIAAYEEKKDEDEIRVGDEVRYSSGNIGVVVAVNKYKDYVAYRCMRYDGELSTERSNVEKPIKTSRHFDQIAEVLEQMQKRQGEK